MDFNEKTKLLGKYYRRHVIDKEDNENIKELKSRGLMRCIIVISGGNSTQYAWLTKNGRETYKHNLFLRLKCGA